MRLINFLLLPTGLALLVVLLPFALLLKVLYSLRFRNIKDFLAYHSDNALQLTLVVDLLGNVVGSDLFNWLLIKGPKRHSFGRYSETISRVLGKNKASGSLTDTGRGLANLINWIDPTPNHVERAAMDKQPTTPY
ncbi:hypothetical protein GCM10028807_57620 [Spirosoma daeguense]